MLGITEVVGDVKHHHAKQAKLIYSLVHFYNVIVFIIMSLQTVQTLTFMEFFFFNEDWKKILMVVSLKLCNLGVVTFANFI